MKVFWKIVGLLLVVWLSACDHNSNEVPPAPVAPASSLAFKPFMLPIGTPSTFNIGSATSGSEIIQGSPTDSGTGTYIITNNNDTFIFINDFNNLADVTVMPVHRVEITVDYSGVEFSNFHRRFRLYFETTNNALVGMYFPETGGRCQTVPGTLITPPDSVDDQTTGYLAAEMLCIDPTFLGAQVSWSAWIDEETGCMKQSINYLFASAAMDVNTGNTYDKYYAMGDVFQTDTSGNPLRATVRNTYDAGTTEANPDIQLFYYNGTDAADCH